MKSLKQTNKQKYLIFIYLFCTSRNSLPVLKYYIQKNIESIHFAYYYDNLNKE